MQTAPLRFNDSVSSNQPEIAGIKLILVQRSRSLYIVMMAFYIPIGVLYPPLSLRYSLISPYWEVTQYYAILHAGFTGLFDSR